MAKRNAAEAIKAVEAVLKWREENNIVDIEKEDLSKGLKNFQVTTDLVDLQG